MVQSAPTRSSDLDALRSTAQAFARDEMRPVALQYDESEEYPLEVLHRAHEVVRALGKAVEQLHETVGDGDDVRRRLVVELEELALLGDQLQASHGTRLSIRAANTETRFPLCGLFRRPIASVP